MRKKGSNPEHSGNKLEWEFCSSLLVAKLRSWVSESASGFSKNPAPMGIRPGRPSLSASWALPRSPIRCLDVSYTPRGAPRAYGLAI